MTSTATADKRKIRRLEEDLEESDKQKKAAERKLEKIQRDFTEISEKYEALGKENMFI